MVEEKTVVRRSFVRLADAGERHSGERTTSWLRATRETPIHLLLTRP